MVSSVHSPGYDIRLFEVERMHPFDSRGTSDGSDNGDVTVTPAQLFYLNGAVNWGRVV